MSLLKDQFDRPPVPQGKLSSSFPGHSVRVRSGSQVLRVLHSWRPSCLETSNEQWEALRVSSNQRSNKSQLYHDKHNNSPMLADRRSARKYRADGDCSRCVCSTSRNKLLAAPRPLQEKASSTQPGTLDPNTFEMKSLPINPRYYLELKCCIHSLIFLIVMGQSIFHSSLVAMGHGQWLRHRNPKVKQLRWVSSEPCALSER